MEHSPYGEASSRSAKHKSTFYKALILRLRALRLHARAHTHTQCNTMPYILWTTYVMYLLQALFSKLASFLLHVTEPPKL
jgi:hypothetical protein